MEFTNTTQPKPKSQRRGWKKKPKAQETSEANKNLEAQNNPPAKASKPVKAPEVFLCIDVECVATGRGHLNRTPVSVAVVDINEEILLYELIQPTVRVHSYLTDMTGFTAGMLSDRLPLADVIEGVHALLGPNVILVGQGIQNDIRWLEVTFMTFQINLYTVLIHSDLSLLVGRGSGF